MRYDAKLQMQEFPKILKENSSAHRLMKVPKLVR